MSADEEYRRLYVEEGWRLRDIADKFSVSHQTVRNHLPTDAWEQKQARHLDRIGRLVDDGLTKAEIAQQLDMEQKTIESRIRNDPTLKTRWATASTSRRLRFTDANGPCRICGALVADRSDAVTCSTWCSEAYRHLRRYVDQDAVESHRVATARWAIENDRGTSTLQRHRRVVASGGRDVAAVSHGEFRLPSEAFEWAVAVTRAGYRTVVDLLPEGKRRQVDRAARGR
jgi:DNA-binding CsgD family transcriptional regulator